MFGNMDDAVRARREEIEEQRRTEEQLQGNARGEYTEQLTVTAQLVKDFIEVVQHHGIQPVPIEVCKTVIDHWGPDAPSYGPPTPFVIEAVNKMPLLGWQCFRYSSRTDYSNYESSSYHLSVLVTTEGQLLTSCFHATTTDGALPWHAITDAPVHTTGLSDLDMNPLIADAELYIDGAAHCIEQGLAAWQGGGIEHRF
jgi:hypothetical protein